MVAGEYHQPYKHQITHFGRVDIVISAEILFFCCENSGAKKGKGRAQTFPTSPGEGPAKQK